MTDIENSDFSLQSYSFELPEEHIAQSPAPERTASRLMVLNRNTGEITTGQFADILTHLPENALLVANNSRVIPARVTGRRGGGGKAEVLLLTPLPLLQPAVRHDGRFPGWNRAEVEVLLRPAKKMGIGEIIRLADDFAMEILEKGPFGRCRVNLAWQGELLQILHRCGAMPLPPYIKRSGADGPALAGFSPWGSDRERYQTIYARSDKSGSVAAPTAGLHFSQSMIEALPASGREWAEATLYVGYGTFSPVRSPDIREHAMHAEYVEISGALAQAVNKAKAEGRPVIAVGTTSARSLEGAFAAQQPQRQTEGKTDPALAPFAGWTDIFLYPGRPFNVIDGLITNFHLPESSLLMLVSALAGRERVMAAYQKAIQQDFRFFSYGDAMLIL